MSSSMPRVEFRTPVATSAIAALALAFAFPALAATPVPLGPCQVGAIRIAPNMPLASLQAAVRRAFPRAVMVEQGAGNAQQRRIMVRDGTEPLMTIHYFARTPTKVVAQVDLLAPRFQLAPDIRPGVALDTVARAVGAITLERDPTTGVEDLNAPRLGAAFAGWEEAGCTGNLRVGPGTKVGLYSSGKFETRRFSPAARIERIEIAP